MQDTFARARTLSMQQLDQACMQDTFARATHSAGRPARRATIGYLVYKGQARTTIKYFVYKC